ncbi:WD40-repeat-containing domain protein [Gorgonomyces haynaldii]|nr:WD40-repeat-containing domain protein [Gorgonomyces haynaldii]
MDSITGYGSSDDERPHKVKSINVAPQTTSLLLQERTRVIGHEKQDDIQKPIQGPINPFQIKRNVERNMMSGHIEQTQMDKHLFDKLQHSYQELGYTLDPEAQNEQQFVGNVELALKNQGKLVTDLKITKKKRLDKGQLEGDWMGPWAGYEGDQKPEARTDEYTPLPAIAVEHTIEITPDVAEKTQFHGTHELDYLGRSFMHPPVDVDVNLFSEQGPDNCFTPKRLIHTWQGHTKGVNVIRFIPKTAHLLLSGSLDNKIKLWDVYRDRQNIRTYMGHNKAVKDVNFGTTGEQFLSVGFDRYIKEWDTETGQVKFRTQTKKLPYCGVYHPSLEKQHIMLVGCEDRKIYQYDTRSGEVVQEYAQHAGGVRSITFLEGGRRFVSTSDDKTLRAWEFDIPVVIKYASDNELSSMPAVTLSHDRQWLICQTLNNEIVTFSANDKFKMNRKKTFRGHLVAGYTCQPGISPDNRFVMSGDSQGMMWFWDWKTAKMSKKFEAHSNVVTSCLWHPHETSKVATCSWDGTIKYSI